MMFNIGLPRNMFKKMPEYMNERLPSDRKTTEGEIPARTKTKQFWAQIPLRAPRTRAPLPRHGRAWLRSIRCTGVLSG